MHPAERYARDVVQGRIVACRWVKLACRRHLDDLKHGAERGLYFDKAAAQHALDFLSAIKHFEGEWAGQQYQPSDWQSFCTWVIFGWKRARHPRWVITKNGRTEDSSGTRRFRTGYIEIARKNGKTFWAAGLGNLLAFSDGEAGSEVYSAATKRDQARLAHKKAIKMVKGSPILRKHIQTFKDNLSSEETGSKYEPLGADADTVDGLSVHGVIADELHAWKSRDLWDVLETGTGSRRQPLMLAITTAGTDRHGICWQFHEYTEKVLDGIIDDDTWFGIIFTIDVPEAEGAKETGDRWENEDIWIKANPNLGTSKKWDDMRRKAQRASQMPSALNAFLQKELNVWVRGETKWMNMQAWRKKCTGPVAAQDLWEHLTGRYCFGGLDLSSTSDLTAFDLFFPPENEGEPWFTLTRYWMPEDNVEARVHFDRVPYDVWIKQGFIQTTPGNVIDYDFIFDQIEKDADAYSIKEIAFDRWGAARVVQTLQNKGLTMVQFGQGFASMSPPMKDFERMVANGDLAHGGNPVTTWMADNVVVRMDPAGNLKPDKEKSREKIDGIVALVMAMDRALRHSQQRSVYEERGLRNVG